MVCLKFTLTLGGGAFRNVGHISYFQFATYKYNSINWKTGKKVSLAYIYFLSEQFSIFRETNNASKYEKKDWTGVKHIFQHV